MTPEYCVIFLGDIPERGRWLLREARTALIAAIAAQVGDIMAGRYAPETSAISRSIDLLRVGLSYSQAMRVAGGELIVAVIGNCIHFAFYADDASDGDHDPTSPTTSSRRRPLPAADFIRQLSTALHGLEWRGTVKILGAAADEPFYKRQTATVDHAMDGYARTARAGRRPAPMSCGVDHCTGGESGDAEPEHAEPPTARNGSPTRGRLSCGIVSPTKTGMAFGVRHAMG